MQMIEVVGDPRIKLLGILPSYLVAVCMARHAQEEGWTPPIDTGELVLVAAAVLAATHCLWWGLHPSIPAPLRVPIIPVKLAALAIPGYLAGELQVGESDLSPKWVWIWH